MKNLEIEYEPFISIVIFYSILCIRLKKELLMLRLREKLTFARDFFSYRSSRYNYDLNHKHDNFFSCLRLYTVY